MTDEYIVSQILYDKIMEIIKRDGIKNYPRLIVDPDHIDDAETIRMIAHDMAEEKATELILYGETQWGGQTGLRVTEEAND